MRFGFIGPSLTLRSRNADCQRTVNLYVEQNELGTGKSKYTLVGTPGLQIHCNLGMHPCQGCISVGNRSFVVSGGVVYEVFADETFIDLGVISVTTPVSLATNGQQILIGTGALGFIVDLTANTVTQITAAGFAGAGTVTFIDGYFVASVPNTQLFYISALNDGTQWDALDFASKEGAPDNLLCAAAVRRQLWLFGLLTTEPWWNTGNNNFPFAPISQSLLEQGTAAPFSVAVVGNGIYWLGRDAQGSSIVFGEQNLTPVRLSNFAIEFAMQQYITVSDAIAYGYQEEGHTFYGISFPSADTTWVLDIGNNQWHERGSWDPIRARYTAILGRFYMSAFSDPTLHLVCSYRSGIVYRQSLNYLDEAGAPIRRLRRAPHISDEQKRIRHNILQLDMQIPGAQPG